MVPGFLLLMAMISGGGSGTPVDFDSEVIPILTKAGCNTGACHGAAVGRGGFKLSLYGSDPWFDYQSIVMDLEGRRVNLAVPDESLLVQKPTELIEHGGGYLLDFDSTATDLLIRWIRQGALRSQIMHLEEFRVSPESYVAVRVGATLQLKATAHFSGKPTIDVTQWTVFTPEDPGAVEIDLETAKTKLLRRGRHVVVARFLDQVIPIEMVVPLSDKIVDLSHNTRRNFIDDHVLELLSTLHLPVSPAADDAAFHRRITLDLTGRLPSVDASLAFLNNPSRQKREKLIDQLLQSEEFDEYWTLQFAKLLRIHSQPGDAQGGLTYHKWLKKQIANEVSYDQFAREIIMASGDTHLVGPANFYRTVGGAREQAEFTSELFMGNRLRCANCHNHPLDHWTQDDYHGLAAIFAKIKQGRVIEVANRGEVTHPRTGEPANQRIPGERFLDPHEDGREAFTAWLTDPKNPYFAKAIVNRLWKAMMGRGLVEPTDDLRATNPATHPALLDQLADDFVEHNYNIRHTLRLIAQSTTYGRSAATLPENYADDRYYSHSLIRPLQAEVQADAISDVTGIAAQYGDLPLGTRAVALVDPNVLSETLDILGRCSRKESCETFDSASGGLSRTLHMFNGPLINLRISAPQGRLAKLIHSGKASDQIVAEFYQRALSRDPSPSEQEFWSRHIVGAKDPGIERELLEDFLWSLLTCREFVTNH